jgi:hypothetical protein
MTQGMSDAKVLRYRSNAVALSRAGEQCRKILEAMQGNRKPAETPMTIPRPAIAAAPPPIARAKPPIPQRSASMPTDIDAMKRDARTLLGAFSNNGKPPAPTVAFPKIQDPAALVGAAVKDAIAASKRTAAA